MSESILDTALLGYKTLSHEDCEQPPIILIEKEECPKPEPPSISYKCDSIITDIDTGFGCENTLIIEKPKPLFKLPLYREEYLGEFGTSTEKELARNNLLVYSRSQIDLKFVSYVTRKEIDSMFADLDFVKSSPKSKINYQIPNEIF